jgi:hypothetical protein
MTSAKERLGFIVKSFSNRHVPSGQKDIFLFATARGGSTWLMEMLASQPGMKYYDEPFNIRRSNVQETRLFRNWLDLMPEGNRSSDIIAYLRALQSNRYRFMNPPPFRKNYRAFTRRIVFKIHELEHLISQIETQCNGQIVYLLRHPIPTTLSRYVFPRLPLFLESPYYNKTLLRPSQVREIRQLASQGSVFERGIISWCYENLIPLRFSPSDEWLFISYEELLLNSGRLCEIMAQNLDLPDIPRLLKALGTPSANITMSRVDTLAILEDDDERRRKTRLVTKWKDKVTQKDAERFDEIMALFDLDAYRSDSFVVHSRYLHIPDTTVSSSLASPCHATTISQAQ